MKMVTRAACEQSLFEPIFGHCFSDGLSQWMVHSAQAKTGKTIMKPGGGTRKSEYTAETLPMKTYIQRGC